MIGLVDGNNFFVSCERIFDPSLEGKPVAVLSNNDGCCISRSNEFKALNIPMGTPYFQLRPLIKKYGLRFRSSNYALYGDISRRIIAVLNEFVPFVEQYSIDEAFIHPALPASADFNAFGIRIRETVRRWVGVPCGVGFAQTKTLAKIANHIGKQTPSGVFVMPQDPSEVLRKTPVSEVWGVGRRLAPKLEKIGIHTAFDLAGRDPVELKKRFSVLLAQTALELQGQPCIADEDPDELSQSISCSRSFGHPVTEFEDLAESVASYTAGAAEKLRKEKQRAAGANVYFQFYPENAPRPLPGGVTSTTVAFPFPTDDTGVMMKALRPKLKGIFIPNRRYKKSGVLFYGLESLSESAADLFAPPEEQTRSGVFSVVDQINAKFGRGTLFTLGEGTKKSWQMKRTLLSPDYTTSWDQLLKVK